MQRIKPVSKFYRRYEVDLWGRLSGQGSSKTSRFLKKVQKEKILKNLQKKEFLKKRVFKKKGFKEKIHKERNRSIKLIRSDKQRKRLKNKNKIKDKPKAKRGKKRRYNPNKIKKRLSARNKFSKFRKQIFLYRIDYADPKRRKPKTSLSRELFLVKNKLLRFYSNIKKLQLRKYVNTKTFKIKFKLIRGLGDQNIAKYRSKNIFKKVIALDAFFSLVEHRLDILVYRSNLSETIQQARQFINHGHITVNGKIVTHCGYMLKNFNIVGLTPNIQNTLFKKLQYNILYNRVILYPPKYIYVDYSLMKSMIIKNPITSKVPFPFKIDLSKWLGLAKHMF